jgi:hypothetical protein
MHHIYIYIFALLRYFSCLIAIVFLFKYQLLQLILVSFPLISIEFGFLDLHSSAIFAVEPSYRDSGNAIVHAQELITFSSGETMGSVVTTNAAAAAPLNGEIASTSAGESSQDASGHVNHTGQSGISIFKRYEFFFFFF